MQGNSRCKGACMLGNPFRPNFGQVPARMAGRAGLIADLSAAFENGSGDPNRTTILIGARGTGKTALLTYMSSVAGEHGWLSVDAVCDDDMLQDILLQVRKAASHLIDPSQPKAKLAEVSAQISVGGLGGGVGFKREAASASSEESNWRLEMENILDVLAEKNTGLLITVDEVDPAQSQMVKLASVYQLLVREERPIALFMAGLPHNVSQLLTDKSVSFLRRACQQHLGSIPDYEVADAFQRTAEAAGKHVEPTALDIAAKAIEGFPFMLQLVGYRSWEASAKEETIGVSHVQEGVKLARCDMETRVLKTTLDELSDMSVRFLDAMLADKEVSSTSDIAERLQKSSGYVSTYKRRLMEAGLIEEAGRGKIRFVLPCLHDYLPRYCEKYLA